VRWRLVYWDIMPQEELEDGPFAWPALVLIVVFALAGTSWAAMLWFGGESLTRLAETISVRQGATILALGLMVLAGLLSRRVGKRHTVSSLEVAPATSTAERGVLAIEVSSLTFSYKNASRPALSDVSFSQRSGEFRCVMGHTGAGKTTLTLALSAVVPWLEPGHFSGSVRVFGSPISNMAPRQLAGRVGLVQQDFETQLLGSRVESVVAFPLENLGIEQSLMRSRVEEALQTLDIAHLRGRDPNFLSGGEKQRVVLASVLALRPDVVILDEPTTDLDPAGRRCVAEAWNRLREAGYTLLVTDHDPAVAASADVLTVLRDGKIVFDGPPGELLSHPDKCIQLGVLPTEAAEIAAALNLPPTFETSELLEHLRAACLKLRHSVALGGRIGPWPQPQDTLVFVDDLRAGYGNHEVLHGLDLEVRKGELVALLGPNGSGKTTLAKCIDGLLAPTGGRVQLAGRDPFQMKRPDVACVAGMVFQNPDHQLIATSVLEELHLGPRLAGLSRTAASDGVEWAIEVTGLKDVVNEDPFALPKGIRQKVALASVLAFRPPVIIFDEPTTGLDGPEQLQMMELLTRLAREGHAVLVITHAVWVAARYASRVVVLSRGRVLLDGTPRAVFAQADVLAQAGIEPPPSVQVSQQVLGQTLLAPAEFAEHVELRHTNGWSANP
jgi:energy-coupling factor transport system ATP-binding protein